MMEVCHKFFCTIVPVAYRPYVETAEFACFGVLLYCEEKHKLIYRLASNGGVAKRIHSFFCEIDRKLFRDVVKCVQNDICYTDELLWNLDSTVRQTAFANLIRPREGFVRYCEPMSVMTDDVEQELNRQYEHIVERGFVDREGYYEREMRNRVKRYLDDQKIKHHVHEFNCDDDYKFQVPFAVGEGDSMHVIKPLNFIMKNPVETTDHWIKWEYRFRQLRNKGLGKDRLMATVRLPAHGDTVYGAAMRAFDGLQQYASVVTENDLEQERDMVLKFISKSR
jgi:hypothetical protein